MGQGGNLPPESDIQRSPTMAKGVATRFQGSPGHSRGTIQPGPKEVSQLGLRRAMSDKGIGKFWKYSKAVSDQDPERLKTVCS